MPPRNRNAAAEPDAEDAPRRATRSSTRLKESGESKSAKPPANAPANAPKDSKIAKKRKVGNKADSNPTKKKPKATTTTEKDPTTTLPSGVIPLTIPSPNLKSPLQCHAYTPPSSPYLLPRKTLIFTHGAGGTLLAPAVTNFCTGYATTGAILAFQGNMNLKARVKGFAACVEYELRREEGRRTRERAELVLGGRSMGARAAVLGASEMLEEMNEDDKESEIMLLLLSYPLIGPKDTRDQILLSLPACVKVLFVIGDKDSMCPLEKLHAVRRKMGAASQVLVVRGADHGMHVRGGKEREREVGIETGKRVVEWVAGRAGEMGDVSFVGEEEEE